MLKKARIQRRILPPCDNTVSRDRGSSQTPLLLLALLVGAVSIPAWNLSHNPSWWTLIGVATATSSLGLICILHCAGFKWQSGPVVYFSVLWLFHFPLTLLACVGVDLDTSVSKQIISWLANSNWYRASAFANISASGFVIGCVLARPRRGARCIIAVRPNRHLYYVGMTTAIVASCGFAAQIIQSGGAEVFRTTYSGLYSTLFRSEFTLACFMVTVGVIMATLNSPPGKRWLPLALQGAVTSVTLLTGARQYALIGVVVLVVIAAKAGLKPRPVFLLFGVIFVLLLISLVGGRRGHGVLNSDREASSSGPVAALAEMGATLQTVRLGITWIEYGDQLQWGGTYWLPIERGIGLVVPGERRDLSTDPRAMSQVLLSRESGLGGSAVAEAYYNFGPWGGAVFVVFGYLLAAIDLRAHSSTALALGGVVLYALTLEVRNWFLAVPAMIVAGTLPIVVGLWLSARSRRRARQAPPVGGARLHQMDSIGTCRPTECS